MTSLRSSRFRISLSSLLSCALLFASLPLSAGEGGEETGLKMDRVLKTLEQAKTGRVLEGGFYIPPAPRIGEDSGVRSGPVVVPVFKNDEEEDAAGERFIELLTKTSVYRARTPRPALQARGDDGIDVGQNMASVTRVQEGLERYLQTTGLAPCVGLTLYHPRTKTAALTHMHASTGVTDTISMLLQKMGLKPGDKVEARLIGGMEGISEDLFLEAIHALDRFGVSIKEVDIKSKAEMEAKDREMERLMAEYKRKKAQGLHPFPPMIRAYADDIIIDAETGEVYDMKGHPGKLTAEEKEARKKAFEKGRNLPADLMPEGLLRPSPGSA